MQSMRPAFLLTGLTLSALLHGCAAPTVTPAPYTTAAPAYPAATASARAAVAALPDAASLSDLSRPPFGPFGAPAPLVAPVDPFRLNGEATREFETGGASWYGPRFHGRRTASGERFDMHEMTAAHRTLPFGTLVRVRSLVTGKEVDVRVTDRGPFGPGRVIDLSRAAAEALGMLELGTKNVVLFVPESVTASPTPPTVKRAARAPAQKKVRRR